MSEMSLDHISHWRHVSPYELDERVTMLPVASLKVTRSFREGGISEARVRELMADPLDWRPIVVARDDRTIIDGRHRVIAARRMGRADVAAEIFDGDPRDGKTDLIDWMESIPFDETRNYVQRVIENLAIYRNRAGLRSLAPEPGAIWRPPAGDELKLEPEPPPQP